MGNAAEQLISFQEILEERMRNADGKIVLNLGCGDKIWEDAINVDLAGNYANEKPDVESDLHKLPFEDGFADEVHAIHVFEHFYFTEVEDLLKEWVRVLKPGGFLVIEVPCLEKIMGNFANEDLMKDYSKYLQFTWLGLYGDQIPGHPEMVHKWCYSIGQLKAIMENAGLKNVEIGNPVFHLKMRDMRAVGEKC